MPRDGSEEPAEHVSREEREKVCVASICSSIAISIVPKTRQQVPRLISIIGSSPKGMRQFNQVKNLHLFKKWGVDLNLSLSSRK